MRMKRFLIIAATLCLCICLLAVGASAASSGKCGDNLNFSLSQDGVLTISGSGDMYDFEWNSVPFLWNNVPWGNYDVKTVIIDDGVTSIGDYAFMNCLSLTKVTVSNSVTTMGDHVFSGCTALTDVTLSANLKTMGEGVFSGCSIGYNNFNACTALEKIVIPSSVTSIGSGAFGNCNALTEVVLSEGLRVIGEDMFSNCKSLEKIVIPGSITTIGQSPFYNCPLKNVTLSEGLTAIGDSMFYMQKALEEIAIPGSVTTIGDKAFGGCSGLKGIVIPDGVASIGEYAFYACSGLKEIVIPGSVTGIGTRAFWNCPALTDVTLSEGLRVIGDLVFNGCTALERIVIPGSVTSIGDLIFSGCTALTDVTLSEGLTVIGNNMFSNRALKEIVIPSSVTTIGEEAFWGCTGLEELVIPAGVTSIGMGAFAHSGGVKITFLGGPPAQRDFSLSGDWTAYYPTRMGWTHEIRYEMTNGFNMEQWVPYCINDEHVWGEYVPDNNATCLEDGTGMATCVDCNVTAKVTIPGSALGHSYESIVTDPTCTEGGYTTHTCANCGDIYVSDELAALGHTEVIDEAIAPTCTESGWTEGKHCAVCGVVLVVQEEILDSALGHSYESEVMDPTCTKDGCTIHTCAACGDSYITDEMAALGHNYVKGVCRNCGDQITWVAAPKVSVTNDAATGGPKLSWKKVTGAAKYKIYRATTRNGTYSLMNTVSGTSAIHKNAVANKQYFYYVIAVAKDGTVSDKSNIVSGTGDLAQPVIQVSNVASSGKIRITWKKINAATKYEIYRATAKNGTYKRISSTTKLNFTDTTAQAGTTYFYKVKAICKNASGNSAFSAVKSLTCDCARPVVTVSNDSIGHIQISWKKVTGATKYQVWYCDSNDGIFKLLNTTKNTYVTHSLSDYEWRDYKVMAISAKSAGNSAWSQIKGGKKAPMQPSIRGIRNEDGKVVLLLPESYSYGTYYCEIWRATSLNGKYVNIGCNWDRGFANSTPENYFYDKSVTMGKTYYYKIKVAFRTGDSSSGWSAFSSIQFITHKLETPDLEISHEANTGIVTLSWDKINGAKKYDVYYSKDGKTFQKLTTTTKTSYRHAAGVIGQHYTYRVRAVHSKSAVTSEWGTCYGHRICAKPTFTSVTLNSWGQPALKWNPAKGAVKYRLEISRYVQYNGEWVTMTEYAVIDKTSYTHKAAMEGVQYTYKLYAVDKDGCYSDYAYCSITAK